LITEFLWISDAVAVIDCGRVKELRYDPQRRMSVLDTVPNALGGEVIFTHRPVYLLSDSV
jgi:hypothetical protein